MTNQSGLIIESWPIDSVIPYERNPRTITEAAVQKVAASIREYGWQQPIVVDGNGVILAGHTRWRAAKHLGVQEVPVLVAANLTPEQARAYRIADNRVAEETGWDHDLLKDELRELAAQVEGVAFDFGALGFDEKELESIMRAWDSDINVVEKHGEHTEGISVVLKVEVPKGAAEQARAAIRAALEQVGIECKL